MILWTEVNIKNEEYRNESKKEKTKRFVLAKETKKIQNKGFYS